jgi:hypothetical protein
LEYDIGLYIISHEIAEGKHTETNGSHFHFLVQMKDEDYTKFRKRVFIDKLKLKGQARNGNSRQYGKVKQIENIDRLKAYTVKDNNFRTNLTPKEVETICEQSFKKEQELDLRDELMNYLLHEQELRDTDPSHHYITTNTQKDIIRFFRTSKKYKPNLNRAVIDRYVNYFVMYIYNELSDERVFWAIYGNQ